MDVCVCFARPADQVQKFVKNNKLLRNQLGGNELIPAVPHQHRLREVVKSSIISWRSVSTLVADPFVQVLLKTLKQRRLAHIVPMAAFLQNTLVLTAKCDFIHFAFDHIVKSGIVQCRLARMFMRQSNRFLMMPLSKAKPMAKARV